MPGCPVSVVIPLYNKAAFVREAVESALSQTECDFEVVIVDDGSADGSFEAVSAIADARIRIVRQQNVGVSAARNRGVREAKHDFIALLDADDEWLPDHLADLLSLRRRFPACAAFGTAYYLGIRGGMKSPCRIAGVTYGWNGILPDYFLTAVTSDPPLFSSAVAFERSSLLGVGGFPERVSVGEDLLTWARLALRGDVAYSARPSAVFWRDPAFLGINPPSRVPPVPDTVGQELEKLLSACPGRKKLGLRRYISLWHRMRAAMFLRLGRRTDCFGEAVSALRWNPLSAKACAYLLLAVLPGWTRKAVFKAARFRE